MRLAAWAWFRNSAAPETALYLSLLLVGLPTCFAVLILIFHSADGLPPTRIHLVERWVEPLFGATYDSQGFAELTRHVPDLGTAPWSEVSLPEVRALPLAFETPNDAPMARLWLRARYTPPAAKLVDERLAIHVTRVMGGAYSVWANGELVDENLDGWRMQWNVPLFVKLPPLTVGPGEPVEILISVPFRVAQGYAVGSLYVGPVDAVARLHNTRLFWQSSLPRAGILVALLLGMISFQFWLALRSETGYLLLALASVAWFIANTQYFGDFSDETTSVWFGALNDAAISWVITLVVIFALRFDSRKRPRLELNLVVYASAVTVITLPAWHWGVYALTVQHYLNLAIGIASFSVLTHTALHGGSREFRGIVLAIWTMAFLGGFDIYFMTSQRWPDGIHLFPYSTFAIFGAFLYAMQSRYLKAVREIEEINASLELRLLQREAELAEQHRKLLAAQQKRVLGDERERLMRDMHDGIGNALVSSLAMAEQGRLTPARMAGVLRDSLDELKLTIDSLEPVEHDLVSLLAALRFRLGSRIEEAGLHFLWDMDELPPIPWLEPSSSLEVLRIVQEVLTNVLKHACATEIHISAKPNAAHEPEPFVLLRIADNGVGFEPAAVHRGRGLRNLQRRAQRLRAQLQVESAPGCGTAIQLHLPLVQASDR